LNHIHLLCLDKMAGAIPKSVQFITGRASRLHNVKSG